jgi:acetyl-CoA acetyltransferase
MQSALDHFKRVDMVIDNAGILRDSSFQKMMQKDWDLVYEVNELGLSGVPVYNVNNNCSTGSTTLMLAKQAVEGGTVECAFALGFEKMEKGDLAAK